jgi:hypothetical protein
LRGSIKTNPEPRPRRRTLTVNFDTTRQPRFRTTNNPHRIAQWQFPGARVFASTYDNFTAQLNTVRAALPVSTGEVGDTWMTSTTADPYKIAFYREAARAYAICVQTAQCDIHDPRVIGFTRMLAKIPEHTCESIREL